MSRSTAANAGRGGDASAHDAIAAFDRLAHDLRSPLSAVRTALQMLRMPSLDATKVRELVDLADRQLLRAVALADAVGDYARLGSGRLELAREAVAVDRLLVDVGDRLRGIAGAVAPQLDVAPDAGSVSGDPQRLSQAFALLLEPTARSGRPVALSARRAGRMTEIAAMLERGERGDTIPELLAAALIAAHEARIEWRDDGFAVALPRVEG